MSPKALKRDKELYCICKQPEDDRMMIGCDGCSDWYHLDCVGITKKQAKSIDEWFCTKCQLNSLRAQNKKLSEENRRILETALTQEKEKRDLLVELCSVRRDQSSALQTEIEQLKMEKNSVNSFKPTQDCAFTLEESEGNIRGFEQIPASVASKFEDDFVPSCMNNHTTASEPDNISCKIVSTRNYSQLDSSSKLFEAKNKVVVGGKSISRLSLQYGKLKSSQEKK